MRVLLKGKMRGIGSNPELLVDGHDQMTFEDSLSHEDALGEVVKWIDDNDNDWSITKAGHRIVHGGDAFSKPVVIDEQVEEKLKDFISFAPLHMPYNLMGIQTLKGLYDGIEQVGCFDTGFHATLDELNYSYAIPSDLREQGIRKYGFHGLSYEWSLEQIKKEFPDKAKSRIVVAHLGNGASLCGIKDGKSVDTTMGLTALEGLPMGTRCGSIDPGILLHLINQIGITGAEVEQILSKESGLKGLSGKTNDVRTLRQDDSKEAVFALKYYAFKVAQHIAQMCVSIGGLDLLVFTGGIGENDNQMRTDITSHLKYLGGFQTHIVKCDEEYMIASHTKRLLT